MAQRPARAFSANQKEKPVIPYRRYVASGMLS